MHSHLYKSHVWHDLYFSFLITILRTQSINILPNSPTFINHIILSLYRWVNNIWRNIRYGRLVDTLWIFDMQCTRIHRDSLSQAFSFHSKHTSNPSPIEPNKHANLWPVCLLLQFTLTKPDKTPSCRLLSPLSKKVCGSAQVLSSRKTSFTRKGL